MTDKVEFGMGQIVYLKLEPDRAGMVTGIIFRPAGVSYLVTWAEDHDEHPHYGIELQSDRTFVTTPKKT